MKKRIWELDALRGVLILLMIVIHLVYDGVVLFGVWELKHPALFAFSQAWGGVPFVILAGICATLGSHPVKRGLLVFAGGMLCTVATYFVCRWGIAGKSILIYFGVLHCLGCCMLLWPVFRKLPPWALFLMGAVMIVLGRFLVRNVSAPFPWLIPLGIPSYNFSSSDYFPLLPYLGYFLVGGGLGYALYRNKHSLLPGVSEKNVLRRLLSFLGRHSLLIYLLHQPVLAGLFYLKELL